MLKIAMLTATTALVVASGSCGSGSGRTGPEPTPAYPDRVVATQPGNVKALCDYFYVRPHETLLMPEAEGHVNTMATAPGIPAGLRSRALKYYDGDVKLSSPDGKRILDERYGNVINECQKAGWQPE